MQSPYSGVGKRGLISLILFIVIRRSASIITHGTMSAPLSVFSSLEAFTLPVPFETAGRSTSSSRTPVEGRLTLQFWQEIEKVREAEQLALC